MLKKGRCSCRYFNSFFETCRTVTENNVNSWLNVPISDDLSVEFHVLALGKSGGLGTTHLPPPQIPTVIWNKLSARVDRNQVCIAQCIPFYHTLCIHRALDWHPLFGEWYLLLVLPGDDMVAVTLPLIKLKLGCCNFISIPRLLTGSVCHLFRKHLDKPWVRALVLTLCAWCCSHGKTLFTLAGFWRSEWDFLVKLRVLQHSVLLVFLCDRITFQINFTGLWRSTGLLVLLDSCHIHPVSRAFMKYQNLPGNQGFAGLPLQWKSNFFP